MDLKGYNESELKKMQEVAEPLKEIIKALTTERDEWKDKHDQAVDALELAHEWNGKTIRERNELREALQIIAGEKQCVDNLMSNVDIARKALGGK